MPGPGRGSGAGPFSGRPRPYSFVLLAGLASSPAPSECRRGGTTAPSRRESSRRRRRLTPFSASIAEGLPLLLTPEPLHRVAVNGGRRARRKGPAPATRNRVPRGSCHRRCGSGRPRAAPSRIASCDGRQRNVERASSAAVIVSSRTPPPYSAAPRALVDDTEGLAAAAVRRAHDAHQPSTSGARPSGPLRKAGGLRVETPSPPRRWREAVPSGRVVLLGTDGNHPGESEKPTRPF